MRVAYVPQAHIVGHKSAAPTPGCQDLSVRAKGHAGHHPPVSDGPAEGGGRPGVANVPQSYGPIGAAGGQSPAVWTERQAPDLSVVAGEWLANRGGCLGVADVPQTYSSLTAGGGQRLPVGAEGNSRAVAQRADQERRLGVADVPQPYSPVFAAGGQGLAIRTERQAPWLG